MSFPQLSYNFFNCSCLAGIFLFFIVSSPPLAISMKTFLGTLPVIFLISSYIFKVWRIALFNEGDT